MNLALENMPRDGAADQRGRDIVEKARQHEHQHQQDRAALPVVGEQRRHFVGQPALLEMPRQQRKSGQQQEQIGQHHPFVLHVMTEASEADAILESGEDEFVRDDRSEAGDRDQQGLMMEQRHAKQGQREQDEFDGNARDKDRLDQNDLRRLRLVRRAWLTRQGRGFKRSIVASDDFQWSYTVAWVPALRSSVAHCTASGTRGQSEPTTEPHGARSPDAAQRAAVRC